jgi:hypothetical protein
MSQSRRHSLHETLVSTLVGFFISTLLNMFVVPLIVHAPVHLAQNLTLTGMFTVASILRGYVIRRHYNRKTLRAA